MKKLITAWLIALCIGVGAMMLLGCGQQFNPDKPIIVVSRESGSGTRDAFMELVFGTAYPEGMAPIAKPAPATGNYNYWETVALPDDAVTQTSTAAVLSKITSDTQAIAYDSLGYVTNDVKLLKVDGKECTPDNIRSGDYKIARPLSIVYKKATLTGVNQSFYNFLCSSNAQTIIVAEGYVNDLSRTTAYSAQAGVSGTVNVSGSTSLQPLMNKLAEEFKRLQGGVAVNVTGGGSGTGRNNVRDDVSHFGMVSAPVTENHLSDMSSKGGEATTTKICDDGIAVIVHKSNTFDNINIAQLKNIYNKASATKYSNWSAM